VQARDQNTGGRNDSMTTEYNAIVFGTGQSAILGQGGAHAK